MPRWWRAAGPATARHSNKSTPGTPGECIRSRIGWSGRGEAEDLVQDIFLLAHRKLAGFRGDSSLGTWLYRLAMNHCLDVLRSRQARMNERTSSLDAPEAAEPAAPSTLGRVSPFDLERAIQALPPACRAAFVLHDVEGLRAPGSRRGAGHLRGHLEVAGAQGAPAHPRVPLSAVPGRAGGHPMTPPSCARRGRVAGVREDRRRAGRGASRASTRTSAAVPRAAALAADLSAIRAAAGALPQRPVPPAVWARLRRVAARAAPPAAGSSVSTAWLAARRRCCLGHRRGAGPAGAGRRGADRDGGEAAVAQVAADLEAAEAHYLRAIDGLERIARTDDPALDPQVARGPARQPARPRRRRFARRAPPGGQAR